MTVRTVLATLALTLAPAQPMAEPPRMVATAHVAHVTVLKPPGRPPADAATIVADCESGNRNVHNPTSTASGYWQFLDSTWTWVTGLAPPASSWPRHVQHAAFRRLWDDGAGASHWAPSRHCWAPRLRQSAAR